MANKPNIVLILVDDMGYGDFSAFNDGLSSTPTLDALMGESTCLTQQYTSSPVCNPSRATLMTGRYPHRTGSIDTLEWRGLERLALREVTLAEVLRREGYRTGLVGKWHLGAFDPRYHPNARGFDEAVCFRGGMHDYYDWRLEFNDRAVRADGRYLTDLFTEEAVGFIRRNSKGPFFLHLTYNAPHTPLQVPPEEVTPFAGKDGIGPGVAKLYGMIARMDKGVARVLEEIRSAGVENNTLVMFTSDNGPQFGGRGDDCTTRFNCQFNGSKGSVYEGGIRVPAILRWPGVFEAGRRVDEMVHFCDWYPTLLAAAGVRPPNEDRIDGIDVFGLLRGEKGEVCTRRFWQWNRYTPVVTSNAAMRDGQWKLVRPKIGETMAVPDIQWLKVSMYEPEHFIENGIIRDPDPERRVPPPPAPELYDIVEDPLETRNVADAHPDIVGRMLSELESWFAEVEAERATIDDG